MLAWLSMAASKLDQSFVAAATEGPGGTRTQRRAPTAHESMVGATAASMIVKPVGTPREGSRRRPSLSTLPSRARGRSGGRSRGRSIFSIYRSCTLAMLFLALHAIPSLTTSNVPTALLQPLSPAAKLQQLSGLLLGSTFIQGVRGIALQQGS